MITVFLQGGLGNQMFQYATGRCLANKLNTDLCLDLSWYHYPVKRKYELGRFKLDVRLTRSTLTFLSFLVIGRPGMERRYAHVHRENAPPADLDVLSSPDGSMIIGTYASEKYFKEAEALVRESFSFKGIEVGAETAAALSEISRFDSVSVHVRRGDYLNIPKLNVCTRIYFSRGVEYLRERLRNPRFFIFSDDPVWCRETFAASDCVVMDVKESKSSPLNDMFLMSRCAHSILSNSSYSWWSSWLGGAENRIVIAPEPWSNAEVVNEDIIDPSWIRLPVA